jgi:hypothetical protein
MTLDFGSTNAGGAGITVAIRSGIGWVGTGGGTDASNALTLAAGAVELEGIEGWLGRSSRTSSIGTRLESAFVDATGACALPFSLNAFPFAGDW